MPECSRPPLSWYILKALAKPSAALAAEAYFHLFDIIN